MRSFFKIALAVVVVLVCLHQAVYWVLPSIKIINHSGVDIRQATMKLPKSNLNFGEIKYGENNRIYYSLDQNDGTILYNFTLSNDNQISGSCLYIYSNMVNSRIRVYVGPQEVVCELDSE